MSLDEALGPRPLAGRSGPSLALSVGALGVVFGDIGTNPLFAMREAFVARHHVALTDANVMGLLSVMFWSLVVVVSIKYIAVVMRADNDGEGGILALGALVVREGRGQRSPVVLALVAILGAALLYGDGMVTPAISVLAAVEGSQLVQPSIHRLVVPIAVAILVGLFALQRRGTASIGRVFGPVMIGWFVTIALLGVGQIVQEPVVLRALWPGYGVAFFAHNGLTAFLVLGAVILVVVGGEALYADMGHFGRTPIARAWFALVLPALVLVYFGQGALLLRRPAAIANPFFLMAPHSLLTPLVVLATVATVIASQALISGAYSLTHQAVQLGYLPRVQVRHTSEAHIGQIYVPAVNAILMVACIGLVIGFRHSARLAGAYGLAVSTTMVMTSVIFAFVATAHFGWSRRRAVLVCGAFLVVDTAFFGATIFKIPDGGWFPVLVGVVIFTVMSTWRKGRHLVAEHLYQGGRTLEEFVAAEADDPVVRAPGASCFLYSQPGMVPPSLVAERRHNDALHETVFVVAVVTDHRPRVPAAERIEATDLGRGFVQVIVNVGFIEEPSLPSLLEADLFAPRGIDPAEVSYVLGREAVTSTEGPGMARWRERLFVVLNRNAANAASHFRLPVEQTVEVGVGVEI